MLEAQRGARLSPVLARLVLAAVLPWISPGLAADSTVTNCVESDLDSALARAGRITFACGGAINITSTKIIRSDTILDASALGGTIRTTGGVRLFSINPGIRFTIIGLTLTGGAVGGADGTNGSSGISAFGGAIFNDGGVFSAVNTRFLSNSVTGGTGGDGEGGIGGIAESGGSGGLAYGGAIYNLGGTVTLTNCVFQSNLASGGSGGAGADGSSTGVAQTGGHGGTAGGAAIYNSASGTLTTVDCTFSSNNVTGAPGGAAGAGGGGLGLPGENGSAAPGNGGAIFNDGGVAVVAFCSFLTNSAAGAAGQNGSAGSFSSPGFDGSSGAAGNGGAVLNLGGLVTMTNCTLFRNIVTGASGGQGGQGGTTGFGGRGGNGGRGGDGLGGGVCSLSGGGVTLVNVTFVENNAVGGPGGAAGQRGNSLADPGSPGSDGVSRGGAVTASGSPMTLRSSILAYTWPEFNAGGLITDGGNNLSSDATPAFTASSSRNNTDPQVANPANNGGPTLTAALAATSPAIDTGDPAAGPLVDQRHYPRSGLGDIGAFEYGATGSSTPRLSVRIAGTNLVFTWPSFFPGYQLQSSSTLAPATWAPVAPPPVLSGFDYVVTNSPGPSDGYYRLIQ